MKKLFLGNEAVARGLYEAGCRVVSSYPGTPSTEVTEFASKYDEILSEIIRRDTIDSTREVDPLRKADDAIEIDSSNYNINEVTEIICNYIENILK